MKVLLVDADRTGFPNLALMKLSAYHKKKGNVVGLLGRDRGPTNPDEVYVSCVFKWNAPYVLGLAKMFSCPVHIGGSGVKMSLTLSNEIEHMMPDYSLYGIRYGMGFTSRGCDRQCPWCIVWKKEGKVRNHAPISEFYEPRWKRLRLLDNNFLQSPRWYENLREIIARKIRVDFNQGLDIRLVDSEKAKWLAKCYYTDTRFKRPRLRFSFDTPQIEGEFLVGIRELLKAGIKPFHIFVYILVGYNTTFEEDFHRFEVVRDIGALPFIMVYNNRKDDQRLRNFARWVNQRHYKWVPWEKYDRHYRRKQNVNVKV